MRGTNFLVAFTTDRTIAKSKIYFGPKEKLRDEKAGQMGHRGAVVGFTGLSARVNRRLRRLWKGIIQTRHAHLRAGW